MCLFILSLVRLCLGLLFFYLFSFSNYVFLLLILSFILCIPAIYFPFQMMHSYYIFYPSILLLILPIKLCIGATYSVLRIMSPVLNP